MVTDFNLNSEIKDDVVIMKTAGYINNAGGQVISDEFYKVKDEGVKNVIMDLADSKVVNSIGISFLIEIIEKLNENGGKLVFTNLDPSIEKTFTIMGLFHFAKKADSVDDAISMLS
jgi:anti-anti-sigma factor